MIFTKLANTGIYVYAIKFGAVITDWYVPHVKLNS